MLNLNIFQKRVSASTSIALTEVGKITAEKHISRGAMFVILAALSEQSPMTVSEIALETQIEIYEAKKRVELLIKQGFVRISGEDH